MGGRSNRDLGAGDMTRVYCVNLFKSNTPVFRFVVVLFCFGANGVLVKLESNRSLNFLVVSSMQQSF